MTMGEADVGRALLLVFSDGFDTASWLTSEAVLDAARRSEVVAYTVAVGVANRPPFLRDLSRLTGGTLLQIESTKDLAAAFVGILNEFRQRYLVSYSPRGVAKEGWHRIEVRVDRKGAAVKARAGYMGELKN
jgi:VWFA-related protein